MGKAEQFEERVMGIVKDYLAKNCPLEPPVTGLKIYTKNANANRTKIAAFIITNNSVFSFNLAFNKATGEIESVENRVVIPRHRSDFDVKIIKIDNRTFIVPYLGAMKLHGIRAENGDEYAPEELASYLKSMIVASPNQARVVECLDAIDIPMLGEEEKNIIENYLNIRQFEIVFREYIISSLEKTYGNNLENRLGNLFEADFNKTRERVQAIYSRYGQEIPILSIRDLFDYAGFDLYVKLVDNDKLWEKCFQDSLKDKHQVIEGLTIIRDFRNEVAHFRKSIHPKLADAAGMYRSVLEGKIRMCDPKFRELVEMVPRPKAH